MRRLSNVCLTTFVACLLCLAPPVAAATITFEAVPLNVHDPLIVSTVDGNVSFNSTADFFVADSFFLSLTGHVFLDGDATVAPLIVGFSTPIASVSLNFGLNASSSLIPLLLAASFAGTPVGTLSVTGALPPGRSFIEGFASFAPGPFDQLTLSTTAPDFAVDNINFTPASAAVPEPTSLVLLGTGGALLFRRIRRRASLRSRHSC